MNIGTWLTQAEQRLEHAEISTARLDCLVLLEDALGKDRSWLLAHPETDIDTATQSILETQIADRTRHIPLAYVRGKTEFYGREFLITKDVLEPRPESETMIDLLLGLGVKGTGLRVVDVGTGSGALAITTKLELPDLEVIAIDIDKQCLKIAEANAKKLGADITLLQGDLLAPTIALDPTPFALLCNLPYVPDDHTINQAAMNEPKLAIFGGPDGLDLYRRLFTTFHGSASRPQYILTESLPFQHTTLAAIAEKQAYSLTETNDFIQVFRSQTSHSAN